MISANGYRSRHSQPEWGYALEPTQWTEYSIHTMDPDNLELTLEFFEVMCSSGAVFFFLWNFLKPDKKSSLYEVGSKCLFFSFLAFFTELTLISMLCNYGNHSKIYLDFILYRINWFVNNVFAGGSEQARRPRRCSSRTCRHRLPPFLFFPGEWQRQRRSDTSNNESKFQTDHWESERWEFTLKDKHHANKAQRTAPAFECLHYWTVQLPFYTVLLLLCCSWLFGDSTNPGPGLWHELLFC